MSAQTGVGKLEWACRPRIRRERRMMLQKRSTFLSAEKVFFAQGKRVGSWQIWLRKSEKLKTATAKEAEKLMMLTTSCLLWAKALLKYVSARWAFLRSVGWFEVGLACIFLKRIYIHCMYSNACCLCIRKLVADVRCLNDRLPWAILWWRTDARVCKNVGKLHKMWWWLSVCRVVLKILFRVFGSNRRTIDIGESRSKLSYNLTLPHLTWFVDI